MKAIYINLDPYLAAFAAWLKGGKVGPVPRFDPLPLAVTIPLGETAAIFAPGTTGGEYADFDVDGTAVSAFASGSFDPSSGSPIASNLDVGLSAFPAPQGYSQKYAVFGVSSDVTITIIFTDEENSFETTIPFTVLVRREQASGPVDLVDFTPPAAAIAAGTDLKGTKFNGNEIVAAAGTGALSAPAGA